MSDPVSNNPLERYGIELDAYDLGPLGPVRREVARRVAESAQNAPHFSLQVHAELDNLIAARAAFNRGAASESRASLNDYFIKAGALALRAEPAINVSFTPVGIARHRNADVAVAVAIDEGLITPVLRTADLKPLSEIAVEMKSLIRRAQAMRLKPAEYRGGTFCISNLGMHGVSSFTSILNPPHAAILSIGAVEHRPVMRGSDVQGARMATLTLTCDHRVVDGAIGARFLKCLTTLLEDPKSLS